MSLQAQQAKCAAVPLAYLRSLTPNCVGLGRRFSHGCRRTSRFSIPTIVKAVSTVERPTAPDVPPPGVNITLALNAHQPINVLDEPGSDALFMPKLEIQLVSEDGAISKVISTEGWQPSNNDQKSKQDTEMGGVTWMGSIPVGAGFGKPGALLITKKQETPQGRLTFYVSTVTIPDGDAKGLTFHCHSTIAYEQGARVFFPGEAKLPSETPAAIAELRKNELKTLRGEDDPTVLKATRVDTDRIYDYDTYRDLGMPWKGKTWERPTLGGKDLPFPRRLTSNRPVWKDTEFETAVKDPYPFLDVFVELPENCPYLPLDEQWDNTKERGFLGSAAAAVLGTLQAKLDTLIEDVKTDNKDFVSLHAVDSMFQNTKLPSQSKQDGSPFKFGAIVSALQERLKRQAEQVKPGTPNLAGFINTIKTEAEDATNAVAKFVRTKVLSWPSDLEKTIEALTKFDMPGVRKARSLDTFTDEEFGRQLVAGQHPCVIKAATADWLKGMPLTDADVVGLLEGESLTTRTEEGGRMFCVDYVAGFLDFMDRIDNQNKETDSDPLRPDFLKKDRKQHAGRALLYCTNEGYLKPVAIQLISDPQDVKGTVYTPNDPTELWTLAKAIFGNLDFLYHQVVSHYLIGHACQEPFIIALMRNVSAMHPVFKLMRPHFRYTLHVNAFGRVVLINPGTPVEASLTPGQYGMRLCSFVYDNVYNFENANFETDLITRGMVELKDGQPVRENGHLKPVIDYPFAEDGLDVWYAMRDWFGTYLGLYYDNNVDGKRVKEDPEIMAFWDELQSHGHPDKKEGWPKLTDIDSLRDILTTIAFNGSVHHSAVNFGNYDYSAWSPNRPSMVRKAIPKKDETDKIDNLRLNYEQEFLGYLTQPADAMQIATLFRILSTHAENEEYLDSDKPEWIQDPKALTALSKFVAAMNKLDADITERNSNPVNKMRSNPGCRGRPYELLRPHSGAGPTGMGVPYSTTI